MIDYKLLSETVDSQFKSGAFKSNFFEKDDLISDLYLYLADFDKEFTEKELIEILKKKYFNYFEVYDIKDRNSYDKFDNANNRGVQEKSIVLGTSNDTAIYEYFEKLIWKDGQAKCPKCNSTECYPNRDSLRQYDCRNCGYNFSFSFGTNLKGTTLQSLKNIIAVYNLMLKGVVSLKDIQDKTERSVEEIKTAYLHTLPAIIVEEPLIKKAAGLKRSLTVFKEVEEYEHQTQTIGEALKYFQENERGKIIHPCGSGKTYTSIRILQEMKSDRIIVVIPSRALLYQQIEVFKNSFKNHIFYAFGSFSSHGLHLKKLGIKVLSDVVREQKKQISSIKEDKVIIFITLKSFSEIGLSFKDEFFDISVFDEAHQIAGDKCKSYLNVLNFPCYKKSLFLTATEKNFKDDRGLGMDSGEFGKNISKIYMREMIDKGIITDYNIIDMKFQDEAIRTLVDEHKEFFAEVKIKLPVKTRILVSAIALVKCIGQFNIHKIITYHASIEESVLFINFFKLFQKKYGLDYGAYNIHSRMKSSDFDANISNFINTEKAVISSVNCFSEGIDVTDVDAVLYGYPKKSKIDIVQTIGRCVRKNEGKKKGLVIIPDIVEERKEYKRLIEVLNALEASDDRISEFKAGKSEKIRKNIFFAEYTPTAELTFDDKYFYDNIDFHFRGVNFLSYYEAKEFAISNNIKSAKEWLEKVSSNFPRKPSHHYKEWRGWRNFLNTSRVLPIKRKKFLTFEESLLFLKVKAIKNRKSYKEYLNLNCDINLPKNPQDVYKKDWISWSHYLSYNGRYKKDRSFLDYDVVKNWVIEKGVSSRKEWDSLEKPNNIPTNPDVYYKDEWESWPTFLQNGHERKGFLTYTQSKNWLRENNITQKVIFSTVWRSYCKGELNLKLNTKIPKYPQNYYKDEWKGWDDFLNRK